MKIIESALERFGLPSEAVGACRLTLTGGRYLSLENHRGLLEYTGESIVLGSSTGSIRIRGEGLSIKAMEKESLVISGRILCIDLE